MRGLLIQQQIVHSTIFDVFDGVGPFRIRQLHPTCREIGGRTIVVPAFTASASSIHAASSTNPPPLHRANHRDRKTYDVVSSQLPLPRWSVDLQIAYTDQLCRPGEGPVSLPAGSKMRIAGRHSPGGFYNNLPPRNYRFRVRACNNSGVWNEKAFPGFCLLPLRITKPGGFVRRVWPPFWQCSLGFITAPCGRWRGSSKYAWEERVNERTRIVRGFHDTCCKVFKGC